jgi:hypothetical protein
MMPPFWNRWAGPMSEEERPVLEDGSQFGISAGGFADTDPDEQRELMITWFHQNFEDPQNITPWDGETKSYMYLWGGPYDATEQLWNKFGDFVSEAFINDVAKELQSDGIFDWAPAFNSPFYDGRDDEDEEQPEPPSLDIYLDEPSDRYGSPEEREARAEALEAIENLRRTLQTRRPIGIGHNQPPDDTQQPEEIDELSQALQELSAELQKPNPEITLVKRWATSLRNAVIASAKWTLKKLDGALTAVFNVTAVGGAGWLYNHPEYLQMAYDAVIKWLDLAAKSLFF